MAALTSFDLAQLIEVSAVQVNSDETAVRALVQQALTYRFLMVQTLPSMTPLARDLLAGSPVKLGGNVGFPSGGHTTQTKVAEARELVALGCHELDVVINIGKLLSGRYDEVSDDLRAVVEAADGLPVKVILECHYLNEDQIRRACDLSIAAGARFVKTGTGWTPTGATLENVALIKQRVGDAIGIKASGKVRGLAMVAALYQRGARRFGIGLPHAIEIVEQVAALPGGCAVFEE